MGQIHELLPALTEAEAIDKKITGETVTIFDKAENYLDGYDKILIMHDDSRKDEEKGSGESKQISTSVIERLKYTAQTQIRHLDAQLQRELSNLKAFGQVQFPFHAEPVSLPVTFLMSLEKFLIAYRMVIEKTPTYDTKVRWVKDANSAFEGVYKTEKPISANKTERKKIPVELSPATKEHKAQVVLSEEDIIVGHYEMTKATGRLTPAQKSEAMRVLDEMIISVKAAKSRANQAEVQVASVGKIITDAVLTAIRKA